MLIQRFEMKIYLIFTETNEFSVDFMMGPMEENSFWPNNTIPDDASIFPAFSDEIHVD